MGTKINYLIIAIIAIIELFTIRAWFVCKSFTDFFHLSSVSITMQIEDYEHAEKGTPLFLTRLFSNKLTDSVLDVLRIYLQFWDIRFAASWFSLVGYFGIGAGLYYILINKKKRFYHWIMLAVIFLLPCIEVFKEPHLSVMLKSIYLWLPFAIFSLYGIYQFLIHGKIKTRLWILFTIIIISIWWIYFLPYTMPRYCVN
jgi:hypothetical protein